MTDANQEYVDQEVTDAVVEEENEIESKSETVTDETQEQSTETTGRLYKRSEVNKIKKNLVKGLKEKDNLIAQRDAEIAELKAMLEAPLEKKRADFIDDHAYNDYVLDQKMDKKLLERELKSKQVEYTQRINEAERNQSNEVIRIYNERLNDLEKQVPDLKTKITTLVSDPEISSKINDSHISEIMSSPYSAELMYYFTKNPDDFQEFLELDDRKRPFGIYAIEREISKTINKLPKAKDVPQTSMKNIPGKPSAKTKSDLDFVNRFKI